MIIPLLLSQIVLAAAPSLSSLCPFREKEAGKLFSKEMLHSATLPQIREMFTENTRRFGPCRKISTVRSGRYQLQYEKALLPLDVNLKKGKIDGFEMGKPRFLNDSWEKIVKDAKSLSSSLSLLLLKNNRETLHSLNENTPLPVFRGGDLHILDQLYTRVGKGDLKLSESVSLPENSIELPGLLSGWPAGLQVSLHTLAYLMIHENDALAADLLLERLGRKNLATPHSDHPVTYGEYDRLMEAGENSWENFLKKGEIPLEEDDPPGPDRAFARSGLLGWRLTARETCELQFRLKENEILRTAPSPQKIEGASQVNYSGTWSPGLFHTSILWKAGQDWFCLSLSARKKEPIDIVSLEELVTRLLQLQEEPLLDPKKGN